MSFAVGHLVGVKFAWVPQLDHLEVLVDFCDSDGDRQRVECQLDRDLADAVLYDLAAAVASAEDRP